MEIGNGGRGGRSFKYTWDKDLPYCDPLKERCPTSAHSRMILGEEKDMMKPAFLGKYSFAGDMYPYGPPALRQATPPPAAAKPPGMPLVIAASVGGGALAGWLLTMAMSKVDKRFPKNMSLPGAVGGAIGGLAGLGTMLLLKG